MRVIIQPSYDLVSKWAANYVAKRINEFKPTQSKPFVIGLPTGSSPLGMYKELIKLCEAKKVSFKDVVTFNLDEYVAIPEDHPESYHSFMWNNFFSHIDIPKENINILNGNAKDLSEECERYEANMKKLGGVELFVGGIGPDGHIAFNEPGSSLGSRTRLKTLTEQTIRDNARFFSSMDEVPRFAITMGVGTIIEARQIIMLAFGSSKAAIIAEAIEGPVSSQVTASALQLHRDVVVLVDEAAGSKLRRADYYRWIFEQKKRLVPELLGKST
jgi:glucosamine-6-phosphate deaminase